MSIIITTSNLRPTICQCVHLVTRSHCRWHDKDGSCIIQSTIDENPMLHTTGGVESSRVPWSPDFVELESEFPWLRLLALSWSLSLEEDSDSGPYLSHLDFCVILLQSIWLLCNLFYNSNSLHCRAPFVRRIYNFSQVILKYTITCHTISRRVGVWSPKIAKPGVGVPWNTMSLHSWHKPDSSMFCRSRVTMDQSFTLREYTFSTFLKYVYDDDDDDDVDSWKRCMMHWTVSLSNCLLSITLEFSSTSQTLVTDLPSNRNLSSRFPLKIWYFSYCLIFVFIP